MHIITDKIDSNRIQTIKNRFSNQHFDVLYFNYFDEAVHLSIFQQQECKQRYTERFIENHRNILTPSNIIILDFQSVSNFWALHDNIKNNEIEIFSFRNEELRKL